MMKLNSLSFIVVLLTSVSSWAVQDCGIYRFKGTPRIIQKEMKLFINEGTQSEIIYKIPLNFRQEFAPYLNLSTVGLLEINSLNSSAAIKFSNLDYGVPNPANPTKNSYLQSQKRRKCL